MNEKDLRKFVGSKIKEYRKKRKMNQEELGKKVGVKNNTISAYERGSITLGQDMLFKIARALDVKVDDLFPEIKQEFNLFDRVNELGNKDLSIKEMMFLQELVEKALSMNVEERAKFLESIKFTVDYYEKMNEK